MDKECKHDFENLGIIDFGDVVDMEGMYTYRREVFLYKKCKKCGEVEKEIIDTEYHN